MNKEEIFQVERPWGSFRQFTKNENSTIKILTINSSEALSLQTHKKRKEFWHVISGDGIIQIGENQNFTTVGDEYEIPIGVKHRLIAGDKGIQVLEIATGDFDERDIIHLEDKYGRS